MDRSAVERVAIGRVRVKVLKEKNATLWNMNVLMVPAINGFAQITLRLSAIGFLKLDLPVCLSECVSSLVRDQDLNLKENDMRIIAAIMDDHRKNVSPGTPVMVVAELCIERMEVMNRCVFRGSREWRELYEMMGDWIDVSVHRHHDVPEVFEEEVMEESGSTVDEIAEWLWGGEDGGDGVVLVANAESFPCLRYDGYGDDTCSICLDEFSKGDEFYRTACSHDFHSSCIASWMMKSSNCPMCRKHIQVVQDSNVNLSTDV